MARTKQELTYDAIHNEGGEGYNPYRDTLPETEPLRPRVLEDVYHELERIDRHSSHPATVTRLASLKAECEELEAERAATFAAEWTPELTAARRAEWNAKVRSGQVVSTPKSVVAAEREQGWTVTDLEKAIVLNG